MSQDFRPRPLSRRKFVGSLGVLGFGTLLLAGCGEVSPTPVPVTPTPNGLTENGTKVNGPTIGLVMKSLNNQYFVDMRDGAIKYQQQKANFNLITKGTETETDIDGQASIVDEFISRKVDGIVIAPADSYGLVPVLAKAVKAGIKVVNIDVKLDDTSMKSAGIDLAFVGPDNTVGAKLSGDVLAKAVGQGGKVVILEGNPGADNAAQRKSGFMQSISQYGLVMLDSKTAHWETDEAKTVFDNMLSAHPDIQGVMASNDSMVLGVTSVLEAKGLASKIKVVGFDNIAEVQALIKKGEVLATVDQFAPQQAAYGIDNLMKLLAGQSVTGWIKTDVKLITASDLNS